MTFGDLERRLLAVLQQQLRGGEISQRRLARLAGVSQPHIHNVLKGVRRMNQGLADALLESLELSVEDLLEVDQSPEGAFLKVPVWRGLVGPRNAFPDRPDASEHLLFPSSFLSRFVAPILLRLAADEDTMSPLILPGDLVLVDRSEADRRRPAFDYIYVVSYKGQGAVCRCQRVGSALVLAAESRSRPLRLPCRLPLETRSAAEIVKGRVVWACREFEMVVRR
jgi:transcriptional regulator with XRE-family HTH domain